jgi:hypothetical protein
MKLLLIVGSTGVLFGCMAAAAIDKVRTLSVKELGLSPETYRGQIIRVCAKKLEQDEGDPTEWSLITPLAVGYHPAIVEVIPCGNQRPAKTGSTCVVGRLARHNGSLRLRESDEIIVKSPGIASPWYLHAQCAV